MPQAYSNEPSLPPVEPLRCPKCHGPLTLARIEFGPVQSDLRTFECPKCEQVFKVLIKRPDEVG